MKRFEARLFEKLDQVAASLEKRLTAAMDERFSSIEVRLTSLEGRVAALENNTRIVPVLAWPGRKALSNEPAAVRQRRKRKTGEFRECSFPPPAEETERDLEITEITPPALERDPGITQITAAEPEKRDPEITEITPEDEKRDLEITEITPEPPGGRDLGVISGSRFAAPAAPAREVDPARVRVRGVVALDLDQEKEKAKSLKPRRAEPIENFDGLLELRDHFEKAFLSQNRRGYVWRNEKDGPDLKLFRRLVGVDAEELISVAFSLQLDGREEWWRHVTVTPALLVAQLNHLRKVAPRYRRSFSCADGSHSHSKAEEAANCKRLALTKTLEREDPDLLEHLRAAGDPCVMPAEGSATIGRAAAAAIASNESAQATA